MTWPTKKLGEEPTFEFLTKNVFDALDLINCGHKNIILGSFSSAVIEFLGRCLVSPTSRRSSKNLKKFIIEYLAKQNNHYKKYADIMVENFRNGASHSVLAKPGIYLTFANHKGDHLQIYKDNKENPYLIFYSPQFIAELKNAIQKFIDDANQNRDLKENYALTLREIESEGNKMMKKSFTDKQITSLQVRQFQRTIKF